MVGESRFRHMSAQGPYLQKCGVGFKIMSRSVSFNASRTQSLCSSPDGESDHSDLIVASVEGDNKDRWVFLGIAY